MPKLNLRRQLDGKVVLVKSMLDRRNPPAALRGTIEVREPRAAQRPMVKLVLDLPEMFSASARSRNIVLDESGIGRLLASEQDGTFEFTIMDDLA